MPNFNRVLLMGNVAREPQLRYTANRLAVCNFALAVARKWKGSDGKPKTETCFLDITAWGKTAENVQQYVAKGQPIFVEGYLTHSEWVDKTTGAKRSKIGVTVETVQFLGRKPITGMPSPAEVPTSTPVKTGQGTEPDAISPDGWEGEAPPF